jgi:DMSO reductase anchor subunit
MHIPVSQTDALIRLSRRSLWTAFFLIALLGGSGMLQLLAPGSQAAQQLAMLLPVFIVIAVVGLRRVARPDAAAMRAVRDDELRQAALGRAYRGALFAVVILQPLLAVGLTSASVPNAVALMAAATALVGALVFLGSFLYFDR